MRGLTSIELAILLAIIIVIAVAVGWYMYTTFLGATQTQAKLSVVSAVYYAGSKTLQLTVQNPGPVTAVIQSVYLAGQQCDLQQAQATTITVGQVQTVQANCNVNAGPGATLTGQVVLTTGTTFPFTAVVQP